MPRQDLDKTHFSDERPEWTRRKHAILGRIVVPSIPKLSYSSGGVVLVDGYAGPNRYGDQIVGSTKIMCDAAAKHTPQGKIARVHACEPDIDRHAQLVGNLAEHIESGLLVPHQKTHAEALPEILRDTGTLPALVFLDPQTVGEMEIERDIAPWARRAKTDVLGIFMAGQLTRVCSSPSGASVADRLLGKDKGRATSLNGAYEVFNERIAGFKKFVGLYRLRKMESAAEAYGFFGLSDAPDGYWLLSEAVAKDFGVLQEFDAANETGSLFEEADHDVEFRELCSLASLSIHKLGAKASGQDVAVHMLRSGRGVREIFGRFTEPDFRQARDCVLGLPARRKKNAQAK